jgi:S1-C subfamily serine protease
MRISAHTCLLLTLVVAACASPPPTQTPATPKYIDCHIMAEVAARAAEQRERGAGQEEVIDSVVREHGDSKVSPERVRLFASRVFDAPVPTSLAGAEAYSACLAHRDGIGDLVISGERVDALAKCAERAALGGALSCGYAEAVARKKPGRESVSIPTAQQLDRILDAIKGSLALVESSGRLWMGVVAPDGEYVMVSAPGLKVGDEVSVSSAASPEQRQTSWVVGKTPKYDVAVVAPAPANVRPIRMVDQAALIHGQPLVALYWDSERLAARLVAVANRARPRDGVCFPVYVEIITEAAWRQVDGPVFDEEGRLAAFGAYYLNSPHELPLYLNLATPAMQFAQIADRVHRYGYWRFGRIGVIVQEITPELVEAFRMPAREGTLVNGVEPRGPAAKAGLRRGDVILAVNGKRLAGSCDLVMHLASSNPGDVLKLTVRRASSQLTIKVATVEGKDLPSPATKGGNSPEPKGEENKD